MHVSSPHHDTCPVHSNPLDLPTLITYDKQYKLWSSSLCSFFQSPMNHLKLTLNLCASLHVREKFSQPCKATSKIIVVHVSVISFLQCKWKDYFPELLRWYCWPIYISAHTHPQVFQRPEAIPHTRHISVTKGHLYRQLDQTMTTELLSFTMFGSKCWEVKWGTQAADSHASNSRQYKMPYTHIHPPDIHACNTPKGSLCLSDNTLHLHYKHLMANAVKS
jgi:hypothetical protein